MASIDGLMFDWALINGQDRGRKLTSHAEEQYNISEEVRKFKLCSGSGKQLSIDGASNTDLAGELHGQIEVALYLG